MRDRLFSFRDLSDAATFSVLLIISWILPLRAIWAAVTPIAFFHSYIRRPSLANSDWIQAAIAQTSFKGTVRKFDISRLRFAYHEIAVLLHLLRPGAAQLTIELKGREHIEEGLARGHGVILMISNVSYRDFVAKAAMSYADIPISHLSIPGHGSTGTKFGRNVITRARTMVENRFIDERIVMAADNFVGPLKKLERHLRNNGIVSITAIPGKRSIRIPLLGRTIEVGRAAPGLSRTTGAVVLPVFTYSRSTGKFTVRVGEPLQATTDGRQFEAAIASSYGDALEAFVHEHPTSWTGWTGWKISTPVAGSSDL